MSVQQGYGIHLVAHVEPDKTLPDEFVYTVARDVRDDLIERLGAQVNLVIESTNREKPTGEAAILKALRGGTAQVIGSEGHDDHGHRGGGGQYL